MLGMDIKQWARRTMGKCMCVYAHEMCNYYVFFASSSSSSGRSVSQDLIFFTFFWYLFVADCGCRV